MFAGAYVTMQVGRSLFMLWALRRHHAGNLRNFQRITAWLVVSGVFWLAGAFVPGEEARMALWAVALLIEYLGPSTGFATPGLGRSATTDWDVEGGHMAERCGLFVIIALGESILVTGATFADLQLTPANVAAFVVAFIGSVAMWWIYFNIGAERGTHHIAHAADPGRLARIAYTYLHLFPVAGIILGAVGDEMVLAHPVGHAEPAVTVAVLGGPALYLLGLLLFKRVIFGRLPLSHLIGLALLAAGVPLSPHLAPLALALFAAVTLVIVAAWENWSLNPRRSPSPLA
jgi:low temperature requirement protein LtrA